MKTSPLWSPNKQAIEKSEIFSFSKILKEKNYLKTATTDFSTLWKWSVEHPELFWSACWDYTNIQGKKGTKIIEKNNLFYKTVFFPEATLNFAQNLLVKRNNETAIHFKSETLDEKKITWNELYQSVCKFSSFLKTKNLKKTDRIAAYVPNTIEIVISFLATAKNGHVWSSCSPDFGIQGVVDRFSQIEPTVLITCDHYHYNGKKITILEKIPAILAQLPSVKEVIVFPYHNQCSVKHSFHDFNTILKEATLDETFEAFEFNHPLYILYSSGTTGVPKCIVHGAGNALIEQKKEHLLHCNNTDGDRIFYYTSTGWMMWNWLVAGLSCGASIYLFDGAPSYPNINTLFQYCEAQQFTFFGTSAKFIDHLKKNNFSSKSLNLSNLKTIASTGSPLAAESFEYVHTHIKNDVHLASISGGTDVVGCLVLGNSFSNVYPGEIQGPSLGIAVDVFNTQGKSTAQNEKGELVVTQPFPSMPIHFWNDPSNKKLHKAYFSKFKNTWHHGDYTEKTTHQGYIIHGRSDTTLNPGGVRIGTAEIYRQVENIPAISESIVIGQRWDDDIRIVLFVVLQKDEPFSEALIQEIKTTIRKQCSPKHVPSKIIPVKEIPKTKSGKIVEIAVQKIVHGETIDNLESIANPKALNAFKNLKELET